MINDSKHYVTIYLTSGKEVFIYMTYEALMQLLEQFKDDSTDFNGVLRRFRARDGSTAVFFVQIVLQAGLGVLQGGLELVHVPYCLSEISCGIIRGH